VPKRRQGKKKKHHPKTIKIFIFLNTGIKFVPSSLEAKNQIFTVKVNVYLTFGVQLRR